MHVAELEKHSPELYQLFEKVGDTERNAEGDEQSTEGVKAICSLCSLLNARSSRAKGLQLMMSLMLIARSTARQVSPTPLLSERLHEITKLITQ